MPDAPRPEALALALAIELGGCGCDPEIEEVCDVHRAIALALDALMAERDGWKIVYESSKAGLEALLTAERATRQAAEEDRDSWRAHALDAIEERRQANEAYQAAEALVGKKDAALREIAEKADWEPSSVLGLIASDAIALTPADLHARQEAERAMFQRLRGMVEHHPYDHVLVSDEKHCAKCRFLAEVDDALAALRAGDTTK